MDTFKMTVATGSAAFGACDGDDARAEMARILRELAKRLEDPGEYRAGKLRDVNGNTVGGWSWE